MSVPAKEHAVELKI